MAEDQPASLGAFVRRLRLRAGLSQEELAERAGVNVDTVSALERGTRRRVYPQTARALADVLGLTGDDRATMLALAQGGRDATGGPSRPPSSPSTATPNPALLEPATPVIHLPAPLSSFVGREREVTAAGLLVAEGGRLVTLIGPGGSGKTRLAIEVARTVGRHFPDGGRLVDLSGLPVGGGALVPQTVALALDFQEQAGKTFTQRLVEGIGDRAILLVLDNCEHVIAMCAELVTALLSACPRLTVLATSREPLGVTGEQLYPVPPLAIPADDWHLTDAGTPRLEYGALQLFVDRARAVRRDLTLTAANAPAIAAICRRLDGLPLAIELAAAKCRVLTPQEIAGRLNDQFHLFSSTSRTTPARHHTLRALIDWSYDLLTDPERRLLRRLAVFAGGWTLAAAEAVCAGEGIDTGEVLDLLAALIDRSLVVPEGGGGTSRYHMLETVRAYALEQLEASGETATVRTAHRGWLAQLAAEAGPELHSPKLRTWYDRLAVELDNLRAAFAWSLETGEVQQVARIAVQIGEFWTMRGSPTEGRRWVDALLAHALPPELRLELINRNAVLAWSQFDLAPAEAYAREALTLARSLAHDLGAGDALRNLGVIAQHKHDLRASIEYLDEAIIIYRNIEYKIGETSALTSKGVGLMSLRDLHGARAALAEACALTQRHNLPFRQSAAAGALGVVEILLKEWDGARTALSQSLALAHTYGSRMMVGLSMMQLAQLDGIQGEIERPVRLLGAADALQALRAYPLTERQRRHLTQLTDDLRRKAGEDAFATAWAEGRTMSLDHAVAYALEDIDDRATLLGSPR